MHELDSLFPPKMLKNSGDKAVDAIADCYHTCMSYSEPTDNKKMDKEAPPQ